MAELIPPCTCGHDFSLTSFLHVGDCPRAALPTAEEPTVVVISRGESRRPIKWGREYENGPIRYANDECRGHD